MHAISFAAVLGLLNVHWESGSGSRAEPGGAGVIAGGWARSAPGMELPPSHRSAEGCDRVLARARWRVLDKIRGIRALSGRSRPN